MSRHDDTVALRHMLEHSVEAVRATQSRNRSDLDGDHLLALALVKLVEIVGEGARRVSGATQNANPGIPWSQIVGTRNRLVHGYDEVDYDILWRIIRDELPPLIAALERILAEGRSGAQ